VARTILQLTPGEQQQFDPTRHLARGLAPQRWATAWSRVPELATVLKSQFGATRIVIFGSLATPETFTHWSDIDLAAWGIVPERFYEAVATLNELSSDIKVDLVDPERCGSKGLRQMVEAEGVDI
jgi:uncharacterized protein